MRQIVLIFILCTNLTAKADISRANITILSTMVASYIGEGEWGFSALIETKDSSILFDTGFKANTVLNNAKMLGKDLSQVETVILSHFHTDHTGGLLTLRRTFREVNPKAFSSVYVAAGFFQQRYTEEGEQIYSLKNPGFTESFSTAEAFRRAAEEIGIRFVVVTKPVELAPDMILSGPIPRIHDEHNVSPGFFLRSDKQLIADTVPESQVLGIRTTKGWLLLSGCGHAGMINAAEKLHDIDDKPVHMAVGGFHLFRAEDKTIEWTATKLDQFGLKKLVGAHCTGAHASATIAQLLGIPRSNISIGAIGTTIKQDLTIERTSIE